MPTTPAPADAPPKAGAVGHATDTPPTSTALSDSMTELEGLSEPEPTRPAPRAAPKKADKPKPTKPEPKPGDEPGEPKPGDDLEGLGDDPAEPAAGDPEPEPEAKPVKAAELRAAYDKSKETIKAKDAEIVKLRGELKKVTSAPREDPEKVTILGKLKEADTRVQALEAKLRLVDFKQSEEFVNKFEKPWQQAWAAASEEIQELTVELEDGQTRPATIKDLVSLAGLKIGEARKYVNKMFGDSADDVMAHLRKIRDLSAAQETALKEAEQNAETHFKQQSEQALQNKQKTAKLWADENKGWVEKFPKFFQPLDGDDEGNALLARGYEMVDRAFSGNGKLTPEEKVKLHAEVRNKAAAFPRLALQLKRARAKIATLQKAIDEFEASEPPAGDGGSPRAPKGGGSDLTADALAELDTIGK